MTTINVIVDS